MPFKSEAQKKFMFANHPAIARRWANEYPNQKDLPKKIQKAAKRRAASNAKG